MPTPSQSTNRKTLATKPLVQTAIKTTQLQRLKVNPAEKLLLGVAPDQHVLLPNSPEDAHRVIGQLEIVRRYLRKRPLVKNELNKKMTSEWKKANGDQRAYMQAMREQRAQILCRAQLAFATEQGPSIIKNFTDGLSEYLARVEGLTNTRVRIG